MLQLPLQITYNHETQGPDVVSFVWVLSTRSWSNMIDVFLLSIAQVSHTDTANQEYILTCSPHAYHISVQ